MGWTAQVTTHNQHGLADGSINYTVMVLSTLTRLFGPLTAVNALWCNVIG